MHWYKPDAAIDAVNEANQMTPLVLLLVLNAGMLMGFVMHTLLDGAHREDTAREFASVEASPSFRDDLLMPILPSRNRYLH
jgi:hypothetical protein